MGDRISRRERAARAAIGMPANHPERITTEPSRIEWRQLAAWLAELWPDDEYMQIITGTWCLVADKVSQSQRG